ncbi:hypothetical protein AM10699_05890 [Acaryochloris marina MBIC10699]|nr:hypothetical protein AM10699_05890 [Acaryochloris marina MBIC10699]
MAFVIPFAPTAWLRQTIAGPLFSGKKVQGRDLKKECGDRECIKIVKLVDKLVTILGKNELYTLFYLVLI